MHSRETLIVRVYFRSSLGLCHGKNLQILKCRTTDIFSGYKIFPFFASNELSLGTSFSIITLFIAISLVCMPPYFRKVLMSFRLFSHPCITLFSLFCKCRHLPLQPHPFRLIHLNCCKILAYNIWVLS